MDFAGTCVKSLLTLVAFGEGTGRLGGWVGVGGTLVPHALSSILNFDWCEYYMFKNNQP